MYSDLKKFIFEDNICRDSPCIVVNVEYRLAPEHRFPANQDDVNCVIEWVAKNKPAFGMYIADLSSYQSR